MGMVTIQIRGSFGDKPDTSFSAMEGGHAYALARAIAYLTSEMGSAIQLDHELHDVGQRPPDSDFGTRTKSPTHCAIHTYNRLPCEHCERPGPPDPPRPPKRREYA